MNISSSAIYTAGHSGAQARNQLEITILTLTPSDGQASLTIGELQSLTVLYRVTMGIILLTKQLIWA